VETEQPDELHDTFWLGKIQSLRILEKRGNVPSVWTAIKLAPLCQQYWSSAPSPEPFWEYLTAQATVIEVMSSAFVRAVDTAGGWKP
jgi:hypothetical protein